MKKRDFLFAGALLLGFGLNASAQDAPESQMFFFDFEDGLESFTDSSHPAEVIEKINYYADDPTSSGDWTIVYTKDSVMNLLNGYSPMTRDGNKDDVSIIEDAEGAHAMEFEEMGAQGGSKWLKWQTAGAAGGSDCNDYEANLFIRGLKIEDQTSYRLVFYLKSAAATGTVQAGIFRGQYNSEKPISRDGESGNEFLLELKEFKEDTWERHTLMTYYQNDSVANNHMYKAGYWWNDGWKVTVTDPESGEEKTYNKIEQFDTYFVRFAFRSPGSTFYLDDVALYKSWIGGAECNADIIRVDFGYQTNLADLAKASPDGAIELPGDYFSVIGIDEEQSPEPMEIKVLSAEYHADGYLYMWLDDECSYYKDIKVNFTNPVDDPKLALKYTGSLYPKALDEEWVNAGKLVPDFQDEFVLPNPDVFATSLEFLAPSVASSNPESGSFNLDPATKEINVTFSKEVFVDIAAGVNTTGVLAQLQSAAGKEYWLPTAYDADTYTVTFTRQNTGNLKGDYDFVVMNMRAGEEDSYEAAAPVTISLSFGEITGGEPVSYYNSDESWADAATHPEQCIPMHWASTAASSTDFSFGDGTAKSGCSRMYWYAAGSDIKYGMYISPRGGSTDSRFAYGMEDATPLRLTAGDYWLSFKIIGWDNVYNTSVYFYALGAEETGDPIGTVKPENSVPSGSANQKSYVCTGMTACRYNITVPEDGDYVIEFCLPKGAGWTGSLIGGIELTNQYSAAYKYIKMVNDAYADATALLAKAQADAKYSGQDQTDFAAGIAKYDGFTSTSPSEYEAAAKALKDATTAMNTRISNVDKYYSEYKAATDKEEAFRDSTLNVLAAYSALVAKIAEYAGLDVTVKNNDELTAITDEVTAATKALTDRCSAIDSYNSRKGAVIAILDEQKAYNFLAEYAACQETANKYLALDPLAVADDELNAASEEFKSVRDAFNNKLSAAQTLNQQVRTLAEMAEAFDVNFGDAAADLNARLATLLEDDQELAAIYQLAIKQQICNMIAMGEFTEAIDMTAFMQNPTFYNLYSPSTKIHENENPLPGWKCLEGHGNEYLSAYGNNRCQTEGGVANVDIALDWNSGVTLKQDLKNLPAGKYTFAYSISGWGTTSGNCNGQFTFTEYDEEGGVLFSDTISFTGSGDPVQFSAHGGVVEFKANMNTTSVWAFIDNFTLSLDEPLDDATYEDAAAAAKQALEQVLSIVPDVEKEIESKYYNLNGIEVKNPSGIAIKVSGGKAQKVLVK